jgi:hypothetical protein
LPELLAVVEALAAPLNVTVAPLPPAAGLINPETLYVCAGVTFAVFFPLTIPAHPQRKITGRRIAAKIRAWRVREFTTCGYVGLTRLSSFRLTLIVQAPQTCAERKTTSIGVFKKLIGGLV